MFASLKKSQETARNANAVVVDGKLILSFPEAITPIVWQIDLQDAKSSSFEVVEDKDSFALTTKKQGAQKKDVIAPFAQKQDAVNALMATSYALQGAHGKISGLSVAGSDNSASNAAKHAPAQSFPHGYAPLIIEKSKGGFGKWLVVIIALILIIVMFSMMNAMRPGAPGSVDNAAGFGNRAGAGGTPASESSGVPVSADDFLRSR
ncbi:MAG: hypothetical protein ACK4VI_02920 [Alphaproteobacteria bacterium]